MTELPPLAEPDPTMPKAAREQINIHPWEHGLVALARVNRPGVHWWHGYREIQGKFGSFCYLCDTYITQWARNWPITKTAQGDIHEHKCLHRDGFLPPGPHTREIEAP